MSEKPRIHKHTNACFSPVPETEGTGEYMHCKQIAGMPESAPPQPSASAELKIEVKGAECDECYVFTKVSAEPSERCGHPLGMSENISVFCVGPKGHKSGHSPLPGHDWNTPSASAGPGGRVTTTKLVKR